MEKGLLGRKGPVWKRACVEEGLLGGKGPAGWKRACVEEGLCGRWPAVAKMACSGQDGLRRKMDLHSQNELEFNMQLQPATTA